MIATKRDRQPPLDRVCLDALGHPLRHRAHQPWLLHVTDRWVGRRSAFPSFRRDSSCSIVRDVLELRMTIELNLPAEATELVEQARLNERVRTEVDAGTALAAGEWAADDLSVGANGESEAVKKEIRRVVKDRYGFDMMMKSSAREEFRMRQLRQSRVASEDAGDRHDRKERASVTALCSATIICNRNAIAENQTPQCRLIPVDQANVSQKSPPDDSTARANRRSTHVPESVHGCSAAWYWTTENRLPVAYRDRQHGCDETRHARQ